MRRASVSQPCAPAAVAQPTTSASTAAPTTDVRTVLPKTGARDKGNNVREFRHGGREPGHQLDRARASRGGRGGGLKRDGNRGPAPRLAGQSDGSAPALDQALGDREPEPRAARGRGERR